MKYFPEGWLKKRENYDLISIQKAYLDGEILQGFVKKCNSDCNLIVSLGNNITGIIPQNEVDYFSHDENGYTNPDICKYKEKSFVQFKIKGMVDDKILLSRKEANKEAFNWFMENLKKGDIINGIVKNIRKYGVFVDIGAGVVGLLHVEDISVSRIKSPEERFKVGQKINVVIKDINEEKKQIVLSYKELLGSWEENVKNLKEGEIVEGIIREKDKNENGIFVELKPNLVGLADYKDDYQYGQMVLVYIRRIIKEKRKIKLEIKGGISKW